MTRLSVLIMVGVLAAAPRASAACRWFGTQVECDLWGSRVRSFPIRSFHGDSGVPNDHAASRRPFEIELQDFGAEPGLCRKIGNETYCY